MVKNFLIYNIFNVVLRVIDHVGLGIGVLITTVLNTIGNWIRSINDFHHTLTFITY